MLYNKITYPGIEKDRYIVTESGDIYNLKTEKWLKSSEDSHGYLVIPLKMENGVYRNHYIARLVAWEFCEKPDGMNIVNHIDENPLNNHYSNLEWTDLTANRRHSINTGSINFHGDNSPTSVYSRDFIIEICERLQEGFSVKELIDVYKGEYGESPMRNLIGRIRRKECWLNVVEDYDFSKSFERDYKPAFKYKTEEIITLINEGLSNIEIMRYYGFTSTQSNSEEMALYDKIRRLRKKEKRSTTIPLALKEQQE